MKRGEGGREVEHFHRSIESSTTHQQFKSSANLDETDTSSQQPQIISTRYSTRIQGSGDVSETSYHKPEMDAKHKEATLFFALTATMGCAAE